MNVRGLTEYVNKLNLLKYRIKIFHLVTSVFFDYPSRSEVISKLHCRVKVLSYF